MKIFKTLLSRLQYYNLNRRFKNLLHDHNLNQIINICKSKDGKKFYNYVNKRLGKSKLHVTLKSVNNTIVDDHGSVLLFAKHFQSVYSVDDNLLPDFQYSCVNEFESNKLDIGLVDRYLQALPCKSSCGPDNIPAMFLKRLHSVFALPLCLLFQYSLNSDTLPSVWKEANVVPIYKKSGSKFCVENYRPISLISNVCKILESIIFDFICKHCKLNNIFTACQHGFRKGKSVITNLLEL